jgi:hypothetical protein
MGDLDDVGNKLHQSLVTSLCNPGLNYLVSSKVHAILDDLSDDSHGLAFNRAQGTARRSCGVCNCRGSFHSSFWDLVLGIVTSFRPSNSSKASLHSTEDSNTHTINSGVEIIKEQWTYTKLRHQITITAEKMEDSHHHNVFLKMTTEFLKGNSEIYLFWWGWQRENSLTYPTMISFFRVF